MATETTTSTKTATPLITLEIPAAGQTVVVDMQPNQVIEVPFDITEANVTLTGNDLRIEFPGNAVLILSDFVTMVDQGVSPLMMFADGSVVAGDVLLTALTAELPETAAGPTGGSGGAGEYEDDMGNLIGTVDRLGVQNPDPFAKTVDLQLLDEELALPEPVVPPVPEPPPPVNDLPSVSASNATLDEENVIDDGNPGESYPGSEGLLADMGEWTSTGTLSINYGADGAGSLVISSPDDPAATWDGITLTASNGKWTLTYNGDGTYTFALLAPLDHPLVNAEDDIILNFTATVTDGNGDNASADFMVTVDDDSPLIGTPDDVTLSILTDAPVDTVTGSLGIAFGADGPTDSLAVQVTGPTLNGFVIDNSGNYLTADGVKLVYLPDGDGGLIAVKDTDHDFTAFTVDVDAATDSYTVTVVEHLDGEPVPILIDLSSFRSLGGGVTPTFVFDVNLDDDPEVEAVFVTTATGDANIINYNNNALGVGNGAKINDGDHMWMEYRDLTDTGDIGALKTIHQTTFEAWHLSAGEKVYINVYSGGPEGELVGHMEFAGVGNPSGYETFTINVGEDFDTIEFYGSGSGGGYGYGINNLTIYEQGETAGTDYQITYDFIATDADLDTAPGSFDVTFDGTPGPEVLTESQVFDSSDEAGVPPGGGLGMFNSDNLNSLMDPSSYNNDPDHSAT